MAAARRRFARGSSERAVGTLVTGRGAVAEVGRVAAGTRMSCFERRCGSRCARWGRSEMSSRAGGGPLGAVEGAARRLGGDTTLLVGGVLGGGDRGKGGREFIRCARIGFRQVFV